MTGHTGFNRGNTGGSRFFNRGVAMSTLQPNLRNMNLVAEIDRLLRRLAVLLPEISHQNDNYHKKADISDNEQGGESFIHKSLLR
jgi:hypothetical protein